MQSLQPIQNPHLGSKILILKNMSKSILQMIYSCSVQKTVPKNSKQSRNEAIFKIMLQPFQNPHFGSKNKIPKNLSKSILQIIYSCSVQKTAPRNTKKSRNKTILKIAHYARAIAFPNPHFRSKIKILKNLFKSILPVIYSWFVQKTAPRSNKQPRNRPFLKLAVKQRLQHFQKFPVQFKN